MAAPTPRESTAFLAATALRIGRYEDTFKYINDLAERFGELTPAERALLFMACKKTLNKKYLHLKTLKGIEVGDGSSQYSAEISLYKEVLECDFQQLCEEGIRVIEGYLIPSCEAPETCALYHKMLGDLCWYISRLDREEGKEWLVQKAATQYEEALRKCQDLSAAHPEKLLAQLKLSALYFDEMQQKDRAFLLATKAVDDAFRDIDSLSKEAFEETTTILDLLIDNIAKWCVNRAYGDGPVDEMHAPDLEAAGDAGQQMELLDADQEQQPAEPEKKLQYAEPEEKKLQYAEPEEGQKCQLEPEEKMYSGHGGGATDRAPDLVAVADAADAEAEAEAQAEQLMWQTPYSNRSPSPVSRRAVPRAPRLLMEAPPDEEPCGGSRKEIRQRMKAAQAKRGCMG